MLRAVAAAYQPIAHLSTIKSAGSASLSSTTAAQFAKAASDDASSTPAGAVATPASGAVSRAADATHTTHAAHATRTRAATLGYSFAFSPDTCDATASELAIK